VPDFEFRGASPGMYPMLRDARGAQVGTVTPGDVAEFDQAPDADWQPYEPGGDTGSEAAAPPEASATPEDPSEPQAPAEDETGETGAEHSNDDEAGETGSEES